MFLPVCVAVQINSDCEGVFCVANLHAYANSQPLLLALSLLLLLHLLYRASGQDYMRVAPRCSTRAKCTRKSVQAGCPCCRGCDCGIKTRKVNLRQLQAQHSILCILQRGQSIRTSAHDVHAHVCGAHVHVCSKRIHRSAEDKWDDRSSFYYIMQREY